MPLQNRSTAPAAAPARRGLAAELDRQQVDDGVEPDDELRSLPLDRVGETVGEGRRRSGGGSGAHAAKGIPSTSAQIASRSSAVTRSSGGGLRRNEATSRSSSTSSGPVERDACVGSREQRGGLRHDARPARQQADRSDPAVRERVCPDEARLPRGHDDTRAKRAQPLELLQRVDDLLERRDPVAEARGVLEALVAPESPHARAQRLERARPARRLWPASACAARRARLRLASGPSGVGSAVTLHRSPSEPEVDVTVGTRPARVRRRSQLAQQAELVERGLELRAGLRPLDALERAERRLDGRSLPAAGEVGAQPGAEVAGAADVERQLVAAAKDVDARPRRRARDERALDVEPAGARRGELDEVGERPRAPLLREPEQADEDLGRRLRVRQRPVARRGRDAEEVRERREAEALRPLAEEPLREPDGVDDRRGDPPPGEELDLAVEEGEVEARVVRDERAVAGELEEAPDRELGPRRAAQRRLPDAGERGDRGGERDARVDERLERVLELERADPLRADLADPRAAGREPRGLEVDDDEVRVLELDVLARRVREPDRARRARRAARRRATTSSRSERASAVGALASAKRLRAASVASTGPRRASTSSTSRSAASNESCMAPVDRRSNIRSPMTKSHLEREKPA